MGLQSRCESGRVAVDRLRGVNGAFDARPAADSPRLDAQCARRLVAARVVGAQTDRTVHVEPAQHDHVRRRASQHGHPVVVRLLGGVVERDRERVEVAVRPDGVRTRGEERVGRRLPSRAQRVRTRAPALDTREHAHGMPPPSPSSIVHHAPSRAGRSPSPGRRGRLSPPQPRQFAPAVCAKAEGRMRRRSARRPGRRWHPPTKEATDEARTDPGRRPDRRAGPRAHRSRWPMSRPAGRCGRGGSRGSRLGSMSRWEGDSNPRDP